MFGFGKKKRPLAVSLRTDLEGPSFGFEVVGEAQCQEALRQAQENRTEDLDGMAVLRVTLVREPKNPYDRNAVRVDCSYGAVGYFPRAAAEVWAPYLDRAGTVTCRGKLVGGRRGQQGFGIYLNLVSIPPSIK